MAPGLTMTKQKREIVRESVTAWAYLYAPRANEHQIWALSNTLIDALEGFKDETTG